MDPSSDSSSSTFLFGSEWSIREPHERLSNSDDEQVIDDDEHSTSIPLHDTSSTSIDDDNDESVTTTTPLVVPSPSTYSPLLSDDDGHDTRSEHETQTQATEHDEVYAAASNIISSLFVLWIMPLLWKGYHKPLEQRDLYALPLEHQPAPMYDQFAHHWNRVTHSPTNKQQRTQQNTKQQYTTVSQFDDDDNNNNDSNNDNGTATNKHKQISVLQFVQILIRLNIWQLLQSMIGGSLHIAFSYAQPLLLRAMIPAASERDWQGVLVYGALMVLMLLLASLMWAKMMRHLYTMVARNSALISAAVFKKSLRTAKQGSKGSVVTLMSVDADRIGWMSWHTNMLWYGPASIIGMLILLHCSL
jgi:hypothetical protein